MPETETTNPKLTLNWFFWEDEAAKGESESEANGPEEAVTAMKDALGDVSGIEWKVLSNELMAQLESVLDVDLGKLVFSAWERYRLLCKYSDKEAYPPEQTILVPMAEHKIKSTHRPYVEIMVNDTPVGRLDFDIRLTLDLEGLVLKVRAGKVTEICAGLCRGTGTLKCGDVLITQQKTRKFELPGRIDLGEGLEIPRV